MYKYTCIIFSLFTSFSTNAQNRIPDQSTPRNTVEEVFRCARTGDFSQIHRLCAPNGKGDGDTKQLCSVNESSRLKKLEFRTYFKLAYSLAEKITNKKGAKVNFKFGPKAQQLETMNLILIDNKWYLSSF